MSEVDWTHPVRDIREQQEVQRHASAQERAAISQIFGDAKCLELKTNYTISPIAAGRYRVAGQVAARIEQLCGVTLEPIEQLIEEEFDLEFRTTARGDMKKIDFDALDEDDPEPIEHGAIRIGRFLCEVVASAIDPFPRSPDAELDRTKSSEAPSHNNPFSQLQRLKSQN